MMGPKQEAQAALFYEFSLEDHIPQDHLLRSIDRFVDLSSIRAHLTGFYSHTGRPAVDPELLIRMLLVGYCFGIRSERRLCEEVHLILAYRWFCRLDLNDRVDIDRQTTRVTATTRDVTTNQTKAFIADAEAWFEANGNGVATVEVTGAKKLFAFVAQRNIEAMFEGAIYLVLAIIVILSLTFGSLRIGLLSVIPNALPILITFVLWSAFVRTVGFSVAATDAVAVGLVLYFTVHFIEGGICDPDHVQLQVQR